MITIGAGRSSVGGVPGWEVGDLFLRVPEPPSWTPSTAAANRPVCRRLCAWQISKRVVTNSFMLFRLEPLTALSSFERPCILHKNNLHCARRLLSLKEDISV